MGFKKTAELLSRSREVLVRLRTDLSETHEKLASLEAERKAYDDAIDFVHRGVIDPADIYEKIAMFKDNPNKADIMREAIGMGLQKQAFTLGQISELGPESQDSTADTPEGKLAARIKNILTD
jgi:hypothetical protein